MSNDKQKPAAPKPPLPKGKPAPVPASAAKAKSAAPPALPPPPPPLFRKVDWFTFGVTTLLVFIGYYLTLTPDLTLEDAGELATGSFYAGVPHPPGYPVWTIYSWLFTLIPISNIAWRVALSSAVAGALSCGLIGLLVSRGSSMILEGIVEFKDLDRKWENALCVASGYVAGMLLGFNGFMWSQAVIVEVYPFSVLSLMGVLCCLLRWMYAPSQLRYLYWAAFLFGICFTNHQTLIVAAVGIEVAVLAAQPKLGRDLFLANSVIFIIGLVLKANKSLTMFDANPALFNIYLLIGIGSILTCLWLAVKTEQLLSEWKPVLVLGAMWVLGASFYFYMPLASMTNPPLNWGYPRTVEGFFHALSRGQYDKTNPTNVFNDPLRFVKQLWHYGEGTVEEFNFVYLLIGLVPIFFYFRMQKRERAWISGLFAIFLCLGVLLMILLNPSPDRQSQGLNRVFFTASYVVVSMFIGYGLTLIGALVATRYEQVRTWAICSCVAAAGVAFYTLLRGYALQTFTTETQAAVLSGLALALFGGGVFLWLPLARDPENVNQPGEEKNIRTPMICVIAMMAVMPVYSVLSHWADNEQRGHLFGYWFGHDMFTPPFKGKDSKPLYPEMARDAVLFGGTDPGRFNPTYMIFCESFIPARCKPLDPQFDRRDVYLITQNALADGTYLSYIRAHYNRSEQKDPLFFSELLRSGKERDLNIKTNLLARMSKPLDTFFTNLGDNIERDRRAGSSVFQAVDFTDLPGLTAKLKPGPQQSAVAKYLFAHFSKETQDLLGGANEARLRKALAKDLNRILDHEINNPAWLAKMVEQERIGGNLSEAQTRARAITAKVQQFQKELTNPALPPEDRTRITAEKDALVPEVASLSALINQLDGEALRVQQELAEITFHDPARFQGVALSPTTQAFVAQQPKSHTRSRLNRLLLEEIYPREIAKSIGGVYPDREILTPTHPDSQQAFNDYINDAGARLQHDTQFPNEPKQIKPGEDIRQVENKITVSGQVAVMAINGLLTKVIFDKNPGHEFYVEESFPLDWMFPYLSPFGIIMKINRQPLPEFTQEMVDKDHAFWTQFSERLIGNWINYDTSVSNICAFAEKAYLHHDNTGLPADPKFLRDDNAQKAFSKLRSAIGGLYSWRVNHCTALLDQCNKQLSQPRTPAQQQTLMAERQRLLAEQQRMIKEADFAFRQSFAFCPYSPEATYRYVNLLISLNRAEDALRISKTCLELDKENENIKNLVDQLENIVKQLNKSAGNTSKIAPAPAPPAIDVTPFESRYNANPADLTNAINLFSVYLEAQQTQKAVVIVDRLVASPQADVQTLLSAQRCYEMAGQPAKRQSVLARAAGIVERHLVNPQADAGTLMNAAQVYATKQDGGKLEGVLARLVKVTPDVPEAWYDLSTVQATLRKNPDAMLSLSRALALSAQRLKQDPNARDLHALASQDSHFVNLRANPEFPKMLQKK